MWDIQNLINEINSNPFGTQTQRRNVTAVVMPSYGTLNENAEFWKNYYTSKGFNVKDIQTDQGWKDFEIGENDYKGFTDYVVNNLDKQEVKDYLITLRSKSPDWSGWQYVQNGGDVKDQNKNAFITAFRKARNDQDGGYAHFTASKRSTSVNNGPILKDSNRLDGKNSKDIVAGRNPYLQGLPNVPLIKLKPPKQNWSDYIPIGAITGNTIGMNNAVANLKKQYKISLEEPHRKEAIVTDSYFTRSQLAKIAKQLNWLGAKSNNSDLNKHLTTVGKYQDKASEYVNKMQEAREKEFNLTSEKANEVSNYNTKEFVNKRNLNLEKITAKNNQILAAEAERIAKNRTAINSAINNTFTSLGNYIKDKRINDARLEKYEKLKNYEAQINDLSKQYNEISNLTFSDYLKSINKKINVQQDIPEDLRSGYSNTDDKDAYLNEHGDKLTDLYIQFTKYKTDKKKEIENLAINTQRQQSIELNAPDLIYNNQLDFLGSTLKRNKEYRFLKNGGVMQRERASIRKRQIAWEKIHQKELQDSRKNAIEREKLFQKNLSETLGTLSKEDIIFLKKMFS